MFSEAVDICVSLYHPSLSSCCILSTLVAPKPAHFYFPNTIHVSPLQIQAYTVHISSRHLVLSHLGLAFALMLRPFFPELVISTDLLSFEHPSVLLFCFLRFIFPPPFFRSSIRNPPSSYNQPIVSATRPKRTKIGDFSAQGWNLSKCICLRVKSAES